MLPPWVSLNTFDASAPLSRWEQSASFDSTAECEAEKTHLADYYFSHPKEKDAHWFLYLYASSKCVATDDRRLTK
jgi:hypothetical protein